MNEHITYVVDYDDNDKQEAQLMLTNPLDAFRGSPRSRCHQVAAASRILLSQVGVSHIYVIESQPPVIFMPTQVSHICSGGGDFRKL